MAKLELSSVLSALREEMLAAQEDAELEDLRFNVNNVEIELQTVFETEGDIKAGGKLKFWVLDIDAETSGKIKKGTTHTLRLNLEVVDEREVDPATNKPKRAKLSTRQRGSK